MGVTPDEFWRLTPAQFYCYVLTWKKKNRRENYRFGTITYVMRLIMGDSKADPMDLFENLDEKKKAEKLRKIIDSRRKKKLKR